MLIKFKKQKDQILRSYLHFNDSFEVVIKTNNVILGFELFVEEELIASSNQKSELIKISKREIRYILSDTMPDLSKSYYCKVTFKKSKNTLINLIDISKLYKTLQFKEKYTYNGMLGAIYSREKTIFRVWSPISKDIKLRIYDCGTPSIYDGSDAYQEYQMIASVNGTWEVTLNGDYEGKYYTYAVTNSYYKNQEVVDPYAKSTGINGLRGMVVDFSKTNPEGWENVKIHPYDAKQLTVYETHIVDLSISASWGGNPKNAKLYKGFYEEGTKYTENGITVSTGFDHIKELGVNTVQILPFFDHTNDEREEHRVFNWGYNPLNYNTLEGSYSSNPYDGYVRIKEFKELVMAYNKAGINIIMDVVYNHVNDLNKCNFDVLMPKYYFRYTENGPSDGSACGNETASDMPMFRKFMIDSTEFWAKEYKLAGFRFDLMGIHDIETMRLLSLNLHTNVSENITVYGEPWAGGSVALDSDNIAANQAAMRLFDGYGCFNDKLRDALIKGGLNSPDKRGWITDSNKVIKEDLKDILKGMVGTVADSTEPNKCVNYVTCHDNYTLYDRIKAAGIEDEKVVKKMAVLANSVVFTSQGISFMLAGEEMLRTKYGNENSYNASYKVNEMDYSLKIKNIDVFKNYQKLVSLKKEGNLFSFDEDNMHNYVVSTNDNGNLLVVEANDLKNNKLYKIVHCNGIKEENVNLDGYSLYLDTLNVEGLVLSSSTKIKQYQTIIAYKDL